MEENNEEKKIDLEEKTKIKNEENKENKAENQNDGKEKLTKSVEDTKSTEKKKDVQEDETKFKKVESNIKGNTEKKDKKKKHTFLKTILIIIGIFVIAYCVLVFRNYFILKDVLVKAGRFENIEEYSYETNSKQSDVELNKKHILKDDIERMEIENVTMPERNLIVWKDNNTKEGIVAFTGMKQAIKSVDRESIFIGENFPFLFAQINEGMPGLILFSLMYTDEFNGKDCYVLQFDSDCKIWVEKETGLVVKEEVDDVVEELTSLKLENVEEIYKPDLTGYEVTEQ